MIWWGSDITDGALLQGMVENERQTYIWVKVKRREKEDSTDLK